MSGLFGIIIGPIISALFITIWEIYGDAFHDYLPEVGSLSPDVPTTEEEEVVPDKEVVPDEELLSDEEHRAGRSE
ncbi:MAG: hypothetical protein D3910_13045 [Candidatus Electrothrix sp. ATG2]|nr:hypothetical protein [Candidatus Electrothrix sp. ATG2]